MDAEISDIDLAVAAAVAGAEVVRRAYGGDLMRSAKSGLDFATDADIDAERAILAVLRGSRPNDQVVGEETGVTPGSGARRWLVDPLCGTLNFAAQTPLAAVNVALVDGDRTIAAVSADPLADELFWSDESRSYVRTDAGDSALQPSTVSRLVDVNCDGPADRPFVGAQLIGDPAFRTAFGPRVLSTTLTLAWVAAGRRAGYISDGAFVDNVHFAAGIALCQRAGCIVTDLAGEPLHTGRGLIAAADAATHQQLVEIVRPYLAAVR